MSKSNSLRPNQLPMPAVSSGKPPALSEPAQLDETLRALLRDTDDMSAYRRYPLTALAAVKRVLPVIDRLRADWLRADQPASYDQVACEALKLTTTLPQAGNINQQILSKTLCEDIAELRPTAWVLMRACHAHRTTSEFLSFTKLCKEIRRAEARAGQYRRLLAQDFLALTQELEADVKELHDRARQEADRDRKQRKLREDELRKEWPPDVEK